MSLDGYALHVAQKYRLAISIAILKSKPDSLTIDEYLHQIKQSINEKNIDDELNISACSDDFNIDSTDDLNDYNHINPNRLSYDRNNDYTNKIADRTYMNKTIVNNNKPQDSGTRVNDRSNVNYENSVEYNDAKVNDNGTQAYDDKSQVNDNENQDLNDSTSLLNSFNKVNDEVDANKDRRDAFREIIQIMKGVDAITTDEVVKKANCQQVAYNNAYNEPFSDTNKGLTQCDDNDSIFLESINKLTDFDRRSGYEHSYSQKNLETEMIIDTQDSFQNSTGLASQINSNIALYKRNMNTKNNKENNTKVMKRLNVSEMDELKKKIAKKIHDNDKADTSKVTNESSTNRNQPVTSISEDVSNKSFQEHNNKKLNHTARGLEKSINTQETLVVITQPENTQFNTHYSESQINITIDNNLLYSKPNNAIRTDNINIDNDKELHLFSQNSQDVFRKSQINKPTKVIAEIDSGFPIHLGTMDEIQTRESNANKRVNDTANINNDKKFQRYEASKSVIENDITLTQYAQNIENINENIYTMNENTNTTANYENIHKKDKDYTDFDKNMITDSEKNNVCTVIDKANYLTGIITSQENFNDTLIDDGDMTDTQREKIPFKVIEEMNKIKMYLNKRTDKMDCSSGYKSFQSRCSYKSSQASSVLIGESATSIFDYILSCSLLTTTQDLTEQISETLGQLIDSLHEDETYPPFLEEILSTIESLLKLVYEEENYDCDVLLKKDEQTQRIILLNKSTNIQKFTIEKINNILQQLLTEISGDDTAYEIQNIDKIENICYIFNILRVILPKYTTKPSTQNSQDDDKVPKKTDITDLWRKKWISNYKETSIEGSCENKCTLKECSAILNKIIVRSMDGYSLVAFSALQCFNLMQS